MLMVCFAACFLIFMQKVFADKLVAWGFELFKNEVVVDEDLPPFLSTVKLSQAAEILAEEKNINLNYGVKFNDVDTIAEMKRTIAPKASI